MAILDIFKINRIKAELNQIKNERDEFRNILVQTERYELYEIKKAISCAEEQKNNIVRENDEIKRKYEDQKQSLLHEIDDLKKQIAERKCEIIVLEDELLLQSFGLYKPRYELQTSEMYRQRLDNIREKQAQLIINGMAACCPTTWKVNNSTKEGERMIKDYTKLILRSFNNECDASIINVKFNNIESIEKKIRKAFEALNKLAHRMFISITEEYLKLKMEELHLCYEYQVKKQQEKEEQRRLREEMKEEAKLLREIEETKQKIEKEERHFNKALKEIDEKLRKSKIDSERELLEKEKIVLLEELSQLDKNKQDIEKREQNTRAGYVYIISNVGSFGEGIYKIGVTRRLEPEERVDELGDASVPFRFDIHAMIFSEDAPALENALHKAFDNRRLNMLNLRREFFHVNLDEIENVVKTNFSKPVDFIRIPEAAEYRQSMKLRPISRSICGQELSLDGHN